MTSPFEFYQASLKVCQRICPLYISQTKINTQAEKLEQRWNGCRAIPRTHAIHFASKANDFKIRVAKNSQFLYKEPCREHVIIVDPAASVTSNVPSSPSSPTVWASNKDENDSEEEDQEEGNHQNVSGNGNDDSDCFVTDEDADDDDDENNNVNEPNEEQEQMNVHIQHGLPPEMFTNSPMFASSLAFQLPPFLAPMIDCIATGRFVFGGSQLVGKDDLKSLQGHGKTSKEKWLSNFVIDSYLELVKQASTTTQMEVITWERFEKGV